MSEPMRAEGRGRRRVVLGALDADRAAPGVLDATVAFAEMTGATPSAVHVHTDGGATVVLRDLARGARVPLRRLEGQAAPALTAALEKRGVCAMVLGAGFTPVGWHPVGQTARLVLEQATKPVVVVPNDAGPLGRIRRVLVPLEGTDASSRPVLDALCPLLVDDVELVVLHVFTDRSLPRMLDRPCRDLELLGREFLEHHLPQAARIDLRTGAVAAAVSAATEAHGADVVVLAWSQHSAEGRAVVVRDVLGASARPVVLLPIGAAAVPASPGSAARHRAAPGAEAWRR